jgi:hypothetical protein
LFTLAHEIGHTFGLGHSKLQLADNCSHGVDMPVGGDDVMGGQTFRKLNPWHLDKLNVLRSIDIDLTEGESQVVWLNPLEEDKEALQIGKRNYLYYRKENDKVSIVEGAYRRKTQPVNNSPVTPVTFNINAEGWAGNAPAEYRVRVCAYGYVFLDQDITASGTFQLPLLTTLDLQVWIDAKDHLATAFKVPANETHGTLDVFLKAGDINDDGIVNEDDLRSPADFNFDGKINDADLALIRNNIGLIQDNPECEPYFISQINYEIVFGQHWQIYDNAGLDPLQLFPKAIGKPADDAIWIQVRKVEPRCF